MEENAHTNLFQLCFETMIQFLLIFLFQSLFLNAIINIKVGWKSLGQ